MKDKTKTILKFFVPNFIVVGVSLTIGLCVFLKGRQTYPIKERFTITSISHSYKNPDFESALIKSLKSDTVCKLFSSNQKDSTEKKNLEFLKSNSFYTDVYVLPALMGDSYFANYTYNLNQDTRNYLATGLSFNLKYFTGNKAVIIYEAGNEEYNSHFEKFYKWCDVRSDGKDLGLLFLNPRSHHLKSPDESAKDGLKFLIDHFSE